MRELDPWTWKQAIAFLIIYAIVFGPWVYMVVVVLMDNPELLPGVLK